MPKGQPQKRLSKTVGSRLLWNLNMNIYTFYEFTPIRKFKYVCLLEKWTGMFVKFRKISHGSFKL